MEKKRTRAQDAAKGLMIIAVIFFHCYLVVAPNSQDALMTFNYLIAFFPFLLSSFFFYTGYNYQPNGRSFKDNIIRRAKQLLIPLVVAFALSTILISAMEIAYNHVDIKATLHSIGNSIVYGFFLSEPFAMMIHFPQSGGLLLELVIALGLLWFLYVLFICSIPFYLLVDRTNKKLELLISVDIICMVIAFCLGEFWGTYLPYGLQIYPVILAIMLTAAYLRQSHFLNRRILSKRDSVHHALNMIIAEGLIVGICLACHFKYGAIFTGSIPGGQFDPVLKGFDAPIILLFSIIGTYFLHTLCRLIKHIPGVGISLQWIGNHSAVFYLFHPVFIMMVALFFNKQTIWGEEQAYFYTFVVVAILSGICALLDMFIKKKHFKSDIVEEIKNAKAPEDI